MNHSPIPRASPDPRRSSPTPQPDQPHPTLRQPKQGNKGELEPPGQPNDQGIGLPTTLGDQGHTWKKPPGQPQSPKPQTLGDTGAHPNGQPLIPQHLPRAELPTPCPDLGPRLAAPTQGGQTTKTTQTGLGRVPVQSKPYLPKTPRQDPSQPAL